MGIVYFSYLIIPKREMEILNSPKHKNRYNNDDRKKFIEVQYVKKKNDTV